MVGTGVLLRACPSPLGRRPKGTAGSWARGAGLLAVFAAAAPATARAEGDIADALRTITEVTGGTIDDSFEDAIRGDPNEALALLLSRDVIPGLAPDAYLEDEGDGLGLVQRHELESLGETRLDFESLRGFMRDASQETGLPIALIDAVIRTESGYRPRAVSRAGAQGLMQLMPETARSLGVGDAFDPRENIFGGSRYLRKLLDQFGSLRLAVAAYNAGPAAVTKHGGVPPFLETRRYVDTVLSRFKLAKDRR
jgi:soluble lytic murein transglycosylase-like protein